MNHIQAIKESIIEFLQALSMEYTSIEITENTGKIWINIIPKEKASLYIGYRGANINALQHIVKNFLWARGIDRKLFLIFDIDGYKKKNGEKVIHIATEKAEMVRETNIPQTMPFLAPADRRVVHLEISTNFPELVTESFTDSEGNRVLKILKKED